MVGPNCPFQSFEQYVLNVPTRFPSLKLHYVQCTYNVLYVVVAVPMLVISSVQFSSEKLYIVFFKQNLHCGIASVQKRGVNKSASSD